ncbi:hypothetical protein BJX96DRAFT_159127 [Aspergillus floccosus]
MNPTKQRVCQGQKSLITPGVVVWKRCMQTTDDEMNRSLSWGKHQSSQKTSSKSVVVSPSGQTAFKRASDYAETFFCLGCWFACFPRDPLLMCNMQTAWQMMLFAAGCFKVCTYIVPCMFAIHRKAR